MNKKQYKEFVCDMGCIVTGEKAIPHHPKSFKHGAGKVSDYLVIPLAPRLHTEQDDSIHRNKSLFEDRYGREIDLLAETIERVVTFLANNRTPF